MTRPAISVEHLSKVYSIGLKEEIPDTLLDAVRGLATSPWRNLRRLRKLNTFGRNNGHPGGEEAAEAADVLWALRDVSFEVAQGEVIGIIGRNGAGKSTLLKVLSRITEPTSGRVVLRGRVSSLLEVGTGFHPELTGRENVYMNGTILGMTKREIDRKFDEIVAFSGVEKFLDTPVKRYSSGMTVRLAFSVAAHLEPEILIIDEVLAVGDAEFQSKCLGKMQDVAGSGRTVLFVSHNMAAIQNLCTRCVILDRGNLTCDAPTTAAIADYLSRASRRMSSQNLANPELQRSGTQEAFFEHVEVLSTDGFPEPEIPMGKGLVVRLRMRAKQEVRSCTIGVSLWNLHDQRLCAFNSADLHGWTTCLSAGAHKSVDLTIPWMNLTPGEYYVNISLKTATRELLDKVERAARFSIVASDVFSNGKLPTGANTVFFDASWRESTDLSRRRPDTNAIVQKVR